MIRISHEEFDQAVESALASIPDQFRSYIENVVVEVHERPSAKLLRDEEIDGEPDEILGLYLGTPVGHDLLEAAPQLPDRVLIFRANLCDLCESREELIEEIRITVLHEIGHHFGMDEDRLEELGYD